MLCRAGHEKGVAAIRFFPRTGHLLLSAGMDNKVKIWDATSTLGCRRSYIGHTRAVRDICFTQDGTRFLTTSYDRFMKEWDTETGKCIGVYTTGKIAYSLKYHPEEDVQFIAACHDRKLVQVCLSAEARVCVISHALCVCSSTPARRRTPLCWNTTSISAPSILSRSSTKTGALCRARMTSRCASGSGVFRSSSSTSLSRTCTRCRPSQRIQAVRVLSVCVALVLIVLYAAGKYFACQSLDNQILIYGQTDRFKINRKKRFAGHNVAGYACQPNFSPDGQYVISGDSGGRVYIWDWKTCRILKMLKAHDRVAIDVEWHPLEPSKMASASWDGSIKYWD